jgi:hypothetical protein
MKLKRIRNSTNKHPEVSISMKLSLKGKDVCSIHSGTKRRFLSRIAEKRWDLCLLNADYGKKEDCFGQIVRFTNSGEYTTRKDAERAFLAFIEV